MDGYIYRPMRPLSRYLAHRLVVVPIDPSAITLLWFASYLGAAFSFSYGNHAHSVVASLLILLAGFLDCLDGDLARARNAPTLSGAFLEQILHWISQSIIIAGIVSGYGSTSFILAAPILFLTIAFISDQMFHLVFFVINSSMSEDRHYGPIHGLTKLILPIMPINTNIYWISGLLGLPHFGLLAYVIFATFSFAFVSTIYYLREKVYDSESNGSKLEE